MINCYLTNYEKYSNYHFNGQTAQLTCLDDIERICDEKRKTNDDSYVIFAIDELQNCLNSRNWNETSFVFLFSSQIRSISSRQVN